MSQRATDNVIAPMNDEEALAVGRLYRQAIPEAIFARLGARFTGRFVRWVHRQEHSHVWVARDADGAILGVVAGTLDRPGTYRRIVKAHALRISMSVLANLYRPTVATWLARALWERVGPPPAPARSALRPAAEMLVLAVEERAQGTGLARRLVEHMESHFREWGFTGAYVILTLANNARANAFYQRMGARLTAQVPTRGHLVNEYHKDLSPGADRPRTPV